MNVSSAGYRFTSSRPEIRDVFPLKPLVMGESVRDMVMPVFLANSGIPTISPKNGIHRTIRYTEDSEILAMSDEDYLAAIGALGGAWANREDVSDSWLEEIRGEWDKRLDGFYGNSNEAPDSSF